MFLTDSHEEPSTVTIGLVKYDTSKSIAYNADGKTANTEKDVIEQITSNIVSAVALLDERLISVIFEFTLEHIIDVSYSLDISFE